MVLWLPSPFLVSSLPPFHLLRIMFQIGWIHYFFYNIPENKLKHCQYFLILLKLLYLFHKENLCLVIKRIYAVFNMLYFNNI